MSYNIDTVRFPQRRISYDLVVSRTLKPSILRELSLNISFYEIMLILSILFLLGLYILINPYINQLRGQLIVRETELNRSISYNMNLKREEEQLKRLENIAISAQKMGLNPPQKHQIVRLTTSSK